MVDAFGIVPRLHLGLKVHKELIYNSNKFKFDFDSLEGKATFQALELPLNREWWGASATTTALFLLLFSVHISRLLRVPFGFFLFIYLDLFHLYHLLPDNN